MLSNVFKKPIAVIGIFLVVALMGYVLGTRADVALLPEMNYPGISIKATYPGEAPGRVEDRVTIPIERVVNSLDAVRSVTSTAGRGESTVTVNFEFGTDMRQKLLEVQERLKRIQKQLPEGLTNLRVSRFDSRAMPTLITAFYSEGKSPEAIRSLLQETLKPRLQRLGSIANVEVIGGRQRKFLVDLKAGRLDALNVSPIDVSRVLSDLGSPEVMGSIRWRGRNVPVRANPLEARSKTLADVPVTSIGPGRMIPLDQLGSVNSDFLSRTSLSRINGESSVGIYVYKTSKANLLQVSGEVQSVLRDFERSGLSRRIVLDQAQPVREAFDSLRNAVAIGGLAAVLVLYFFLRHISYVLVLAVTLPVSIMMVVIVLYLLSYSLNIVTLSGIALGVGMLVDSAIVILENIIRNRQEDHDRFESMVRGTRQMVLPLLASVLTTVIVFLPLLFVDSRIKQLYGGLAVTVTAALFGSFLVAVFLVPVLVGLTEFEPSTRFEWLQETYRSWLTGLLESHRLLIPVVLVALILGCSVFLFVEQSLSVPFQGRNVSLKVEVEPGTPLPQSRRLVTDLESILGEKNFIETYSTNFSDWSGTINIQLKSLSESPVSVDRAIERMQGELEPLRRRGLKAFFQRDNQGGQGRSLRVEITGPEFSKLFDIGRGLMDRLSGLEFLTNTHLVLPNPIPAYQLELNRDRLAQFNLTPRYFFEALRSRLAGRVATRLPTKEGEREVVMRGEPTDVRRVSDLDAMTLRTPDGRNIDVSSMVTLKQKAIGSSIQRKDGKRTGFLVARVEGTSLLEAYKTVLDISNAMPLPDGYSYRMGNQYEELRTVRTNLYWLIAVTVGLIYLVLMGTLESLWQPILIMLAVPAAVLGAVWVLFLWSLPLSLSAYVGLLILMGLVVNSSVVMISRISAHRVEGKSLEEAVYRGAVERLQPILMTSLTTVLAMIPLLLVGPSGTALSTPLAVTVIAGLMVGVAFNLFVLPVIYYTVETYLGMAVSQ